MRLAVGCSRPLLGVALALWAGVATADTSAPVRLRRFALLVGTNDGGEGRVRLRYAVSDAQAVARVLGELGGVAPEDRTLLVEAGRREVEGALERLRQRLAAVPADVRTEAVLYFSGHADEEGLLLKGERFPYRELRRALERLPADVRIAILDSCASGAFTRTKGGARRPAFLVDASSRVRGHAILTSSSEDEVSQESDRIGGSFFTHHLVSGLRGAADLSRDGRVTLNEAYHFAFSETLARTETTRGGPQHPAYDIELAGSGDLVMTDLRATSAGLVLDEALEGRVAIRDAQGALVVELAKARGRPTELGLAPGRYSVYREASGRRERAEVTLAAGNPASLTPASFSPLPTEAVAFRGGTPPPPARVQLRPPGWVNVGLWPGLDTNALRDTPADNLLSVALLVGRSPRLRGLALGLGGNWTERETTGLQLTLGLNASNGDVLGAQGALVGNAVTGRLTGLQGTAGFNFARDRVRGVQLALGANLAGADLEGVQGAVGLNWAQGDVRVGQLALGGNVAAGTLAGVQGAMGLNWTQGALTGAQLAFGLNVAVQPAQGLQAGVGANWAHASLAGAQLALGANYAAALRGLQVGLLNVGGDVGGAQVGLLNVARRVTGTQVGLLNIADEAHGLPVGLLSVSRNGLLHLEGYTSDLHPVHFALKVGGRHLYTVLHAGGDLQRQPDAGSTLGLGFGVHLPLGPHFAELEATGGAFLRYDASRPLQPLLQARMVAGVQLAPRLALIVGPTLNWLWSVPPELGVDRVSSLPTHGAAWRAWWPGFTAGLRL